MGNDADEIRNEIEQTRGRISETADAIGYKADAPARVRENINERIEGAKQSVRTGVETITSMMAGSGDAMQRTADNATGAMRSATDDAKENIRSATGRVIRNPLGLAVGAWAVGFLAGLAVPVSAIEQRSIEPLRDAIAEQIQSAGLVEHGKAILQETAQAAMTSGQEHAGKIVESVSNRSNGEGQNVN